MSTPKHHKGYYSIIQYCPDLSRLEAANVGVVLFCPELSFIRAHVTESNDRIRRFFQSEHHDWERINAIKMAVKDRFDADFVSFTDLKDLEHFIATRANNMMLTAPRSMLVEDPDRDLAALFEQLVGGRKITASHQHHSSVARTLSDAFAGDRFKSIIRRDVSVKIPVMQKVITVPYAYKNGDFNLVQPQLFDQSTEDGIHKIACLRAVEGRLLYQHQFPGNIKHRMIIVAEFSGKAADYATPVCDLLKNSNVEVRSVAQIDDLAKHVLETGKPMPEDQMLAI